MNILKITLTFIALFTFFASPFDCYAQDHVIVKIKLKDKHCQGFKLNINGTETSNNHAKMLKFAMKNNKTHKVELFTRKQGNRSVYMQGLPINTQKKKLVFKVKRFNGKYYLKQPNQKGSMVGKSLKNLGDSVADRYNGPGSAYAKDAAQLSDLFRGLGKKTPRKYGRDVVLLRVRYAK